MGKEIWAVAQMRGTGLALVSFEVLGAARDLAQKTGATVAAVVHGAGAFALAAELHKRGAAKVYAAEGADPDGFVDDLAARVLAAAIRQYQPLAVLGAATFYGKSLFARAATAADVGLIPDVNRLDVEAGSVVAYRPCFGGNIVRRAQVKPGAILVATLRPKVFAEAAADGSPAGETIQLPVEGKAEIKVAESVTERGQTINLNEADVIVAGGRGLREAESFKLIFEMADALGGAVGASRAVVDAGWIPYAHQVGQTGKTVNPKLYVAIGISGAIQHLVGMQSSGVIVAVNKDPDAPIFKIATFGIVGDAFEHAPAMTRLFREKLGR
jgi:electron transfer flavoprotein alpha subunit